MSEGSDAGRTSATGRRAPPPFRRVLVHGVAELSAYMIRVTFAGPDLDGLVVAEPAASVRLLLPSPGRPELVIPVWNGNEFLLPGGERPVIRTFTPRRVDADARELDLDMVIHRNGIASAWAQAATAGAPAAVSGPGRGYRVDPAASAFLLGGDETAIPAISQLLETIPADKPVAVHIEVAHPDARLPLPGHPRAVVEWHDLPAGAAPGESLVAALVAAEIHSDARIWCAGEAAAMHKIRRYLFEHAGVSRSQAAVRGYWKQGRTPADKGTRRAD